jgi:hypothetical protein
MKQSHKIDAVRASQFNWHLTGTWQLVVRTAAMSIDEFLAKIGVAIFLKQKSQRLFRTSI